MIWAAIIGIIINLLHWLWQWFNGNTRPLTTYEQQRLGVVLGLGNKIRGELMARGVAPVEEPPQVEASDTLRLLTHVKEEISKVTTTIEQSKGD